MQLPAEVRVAICTLFLQDALLCWTEDATQPRRIRTVVQTQMPIHNVLLQICRLMRHECAPLYAKWIKVEEYNAVRKSWSQVPLNTFEDVGVQIVWGHFPSIKEAKIV